MGYNPNTLSQGEISQLIILLLVNKGDILTRTVTTITNLVVRTDSQVLMADSTKTTGLKYSDTINTLTSGSSAALILMPLSTATNGIINGLTTGNADILTNMVAPFGGGDITLNPGAKVVLTDNSVTLTNGQASLINP